MIAVLEPSWPVRLAHWAKTGWRHDVLMGSLALGVIGMIFVSGIVWTTDDNGNRTSWAPQAMYGWALPVVALLSLASASILDLRWEIRVSPWRGGNDLEAAREIWDRLPAADRQETLPLMRAAYAAAERGEAEEVATRLTLLQELDAEIVKQVAARKREAPDLAQVRTLIEGKKIANESMAEVRELGGEQE